MKIRKTGLNLFSYSSKINRPLILDGAMGSLLRRKYAPEGTLWMSYLNKTAPDEILKIHKSYINAGADIITTNTFRTNPLACVNSPFGAFSDLACQGVKIAIEAANGKNVLVAGSNAPAEDCYKAKREISYNKLASNHFNHINILADSGADLILNETLSHLDEIQIICRHCSDLNIPFIISLYLDENLRILSGEKLTDVVKLIRDFAPLAIGLNCIKTEVFNKINLNKIKYPWGAYLNCGTGKQTDDLIKKSLSPLQYLDEIKNMFNYSPAFVGACCGSTPGHIRKIKEYIDEKH
jgi:homocysteine S-methyltransferase